MNRNQWYIVQRVGLSVVSLVAVLTILFLMFRLLPGDPATTLASPRFSEADRQALLEQHGLTEPLHVQYVLYWQNLLQGDLGLSIQHNTAVLPLLLDRTLNTLAITFPAVLLAFTFGPIFGANFAWRRNESLDVYGTGAVLLMYAAPIFWTGMLALMVFSFYFGWLPTGGMYPADYVEERLTDRFFSTDFVRHAILPIVIFFLWRLSQPTLIVRNTMIDVMNADFITLKKAEGIPDPTIKYRHGLRNSILPVLHYSALALGYAFGGSIILETVFSWPGLGLAMWNAVLASDYPMAMGAFLMISTIIIILNLVVDVLSIYIDPRVAEGEMEV